MTTGHAPGNRFGSARATLETTSGSVAYYRLDSLIDIGVVADRSSLQRLPMTIKILLENLLRNAGNGLQPSFERDVPCRFELREPIRWKCFARLVLDRRDNVAHALADERRHAFRHRHRPTGFGDEARHDVVGEFFGIHKHAVAVEDDEGGAGHEVTSDNSKSKSSCGVNWKYHFSLPVSGSSVTTQSEYRLSPGRRSAVQSGPGLPTPQ